MVLFRLKFRSNFMVIRSALTCTENDRSWPCWMTSRWKILEEALFCASILFIRIPQPFTVSSDSQFLEFWPHGGARVFKCPFELSSCSFDFTVLNMGIFGKKYPKVAVNDHCWIDFPKCPGGESHLQNYTVYHIKSLLIDNKLFFQQPIKNQGINQLSWQR